MRVLEPAYKAFGSWLRVHRRLAGMTQEQVGKAAGLSREMVASVEGGHSRVLLHDVIALIDAVEKPIRLAKVA